MTQDKTITQAIHDNPLPSSQQENHLSWPQQEKVPSMDIIIRPLVVINLDDDETTKIDEEVHNVLNLLFPSSMILNNNNHNDPPKYTNSPCVEPSGVPSMTIIPLASYLPSSYDEQDWDANKLL